ncbi:hypothetical protein [Methylocystis hirsuta]|uniref:Uncharacterized protein n=1 Tax=Methylocystis hirsuta TaxID=369798 RepID=A0A3M9XNH3_9HYPH|nr:hypothetical protein [Methylocystis hirsuta]RNJ49385.1 hypothetical protein D1O30_06995 [Methylocystis hirsuta]
MQLHITIDDGKSVAGADAWTQRQELANILTAVVADLLDEGIAPGDKKPLRDRNGHTVGTAHLAE